MKKKQLLSEYGMIHCVVIAVILIGALITWRVSFNLNGNNIMSGVIVVIAVLLMVALHIGIQTILGSVISTVNVVSEKVGGMESKGAQNSEGFNDAELEEIANEDEEEKEKKIDIAIKYAQSTFCGKMSDEDLNRLTSYIRVYSEGEEIQNITPITITANEYKKADYYVFWGNIYTYVGGNGDLWATALIKMFQLEGTSPRHIKSNWRKENKNQLIMRDDYLMSYKKQLENKYCLRFSNVART